MFKCSVKCSNVVSNVQMFCQIFKCSVICKCSNVQMFSQMFKCSNVVSNVQMFCQIFKCSVIFKCSNVQMSSQMFWEKRKPLRRCSSQMKPQLKGSPSPSLPACDLHKWNKNKSIEKTPCTIQGLCRSSRNLSGLSPIFKERQVGPKGTLRNTVSKSMFSCHKY